MKIPYSLHEAELLCKEYQYLVGTFVESINATVESVVVTPFDQPNKQRFFLYYHLFDRDAQLALTHEYKGLFFDVMMMSSDARGDLKYDDVTSVLCKSNFETDEYPTCSISGENRSVNYI